MSFSNEDLERLTEDTSRTLSGVYLPKDKLLSLLTRMEAAEQALNCEAVRGDPLYEAWRKACGE